MKIRQKICITVILILCIFAVCPSCASRRQTSSYDEAESRNNMLAGVETTEKANVDEEIEYDDYDLVILRYYNVVIDEAAEQLTEELGWKIKIVDYDVDDYYKLNTKLMARDDDFDLYIDSSWDFSKYMLGGFYTDLKQFDSLKEKMSSNRLVDFAADYNGEYIGVPLYLTYNNELPFSNTSPAILDYCAKNVDSLEKRFSDPDGKKLFEVLRYVYDNDGDVKEDPREHIDFSFIESSYCIMSPNAKHKEEAALFLERLFDAFQSMPEGPFSARYPDIGDADLSDTYMTWRFMGVEVRRPIVDAYNAALESDGKDSTLQKLAEEAASKVAMWIGE